MPFEDFKIIIDKFKYLKFLTLHGWGEPILNPELFRMIDYAYRKGIITAFATSGGSLSPDISLKLLDSNLDKLVFSIDAAEPYLLESIRKNNHLKEVINNIRQLSNLKKELQKNNPILTINPTILKENVVHLDKIVGLAKELEIDEISFHIVYYPDKNSFETVGVDKAEFKKILDNLSQLGKSLNIKVEFPSLKFGHKLCVDSWFRPFVAVNGDIFVCCYQREPMGNILREDLSDIWNRRSYKIFRKRIKNNPNDICKNCPNLIT
jgi:MoaA/NifB/PqqE/SkfB family radical SAM enzyme